jgi:hypothetical protein
MCHAYKDYENDTRKELVQDHALYRILVMVMAVTHPTWTVKKKAVCISKTLETLLTSTHYKDLKVESTSTVNHHANLKKICINSLPPDSFYMFNPLLLPMIRCPGHTRRQQE